MIANDMAIGVLRFERMAEAVFLRGGIKSTRVGRGPFQVSRRGHARDLIIMRGI